MHLSDVLVLPVSPTALLVLLLAAARTGFISPDAWNVFMHLPSAPASLIIWHGTFTLLLCLLRFLSRLLLPEMRVVQKTAHMPEN